jgi:LuxR family maltose regulon positive regulatory protein
MSEDSFAVTRAKLQQPRLRHDLVARGHLFQRLDAGLQRHLTLLSAPAGFGKTTVVAAWLRDQPRPASWISLDRHDNDLFSFVTDLVGAVRLTFPGACRTLSTVLHLRQAMSADGLAALVSNELDELPNDLVLVLDDYHVVDDPQVHGLIGALVHRPPSRLHLIVASRVDPPLPIARLRAAGQLAELRAAHLRFTAAETRDFLAGVVGPDVDAQTVSVLHARTEGWVTGLRLVAASLLDRNDTSAFVETLASDNRQVTDFLLDEVISGQPPGVQEFLLATSLPDRFCASLCDALLDHRPGAGASQAMLDWIERGNLFIVPLDDRRGWYRYHRLFRRLLQQRLRSQSEPAAIVALQRRASTWFVEHGLVEDAIAQLLAAGDPGAAANLVEGQVHRLLDREEWPRLERWLMLLPDALVRTRPRLLVAQAWLLHLTGRPAAIQTLLETASELLNADRSDPDAAAVHGDIELLTAVALSADGEVDRTLAHVRRALNLLPAEHDYMRGSADLTLSAALRTLGQRGAGLQLLESAVARYHADGQPRREARALLGLAVSYAAAAETHELERVARRLLHIGEEHELATSVSQGQYWLGRVAYEWDNLDAAAMRFKAALRDPERLDFTTLRDGMFGLALTETAQGNHDAARAVYTDLLTTAERASGNQLLGVVRSFRARLALLRDDVASAAHWLQSVNLTALQPPGPADVEVPRLTEARLLVALGTWPSLGAASRKIETLVRLYESRHEVLFVIRALALQALLCQARGDLGAAAEALYRAVGLARSGGLVRTFVDLGVGMQRLLRQLETDDGTAEYRERLLAQIPAAPSAFASPSIERGRLIEELTQRELEVLELLNARLSNKEIAARLIISDRTVKRHTINLYQKLSVNGRRQAVSRARSLGLLRSV